jgi:AraC-like DNA-binding protein
VIGNLRSREPILIWLSWKSAFDPEIGLDCQMWYTDTVSFGASESVCAVRRLVGAARGLGLVLDEGPSAREPVITARISARSAHGLWDRAVRALGPSLPLAVAAAVDDHLCLMQLAAMSCATIGEVVELLVAHWRYVTDAYPARAVRRCGAVHLELAAVGPLPLGARAGVEYMVATLARACAELTGGECRPRAVVLGHCPPLALDAWQAACGAPVELGACAALVIDDEALARPVRSGLSPSAGRMFRELLAWHTPRPPPTLTERVAAELARDLAGATPTVEQVAAELGLSARSLHRQLAAEGTSYQRVLDHVRCDEAIRQAVDARRPFKAIAAAVGFADPRAFRRAFKRWTGTTPQQFRMRGQLD